MEILMKDDSRIFESHPILQPYDDNTESQLFSFLDVIRLIIQQPDQEADRNNWRKRKKETRHKKIANSKYFYLN
jgi:hypothetical protein